LRTTVVLVVVVVTLVAADLIARRVAEGQLERRVEGVVSSKGGPVHAVKVRIDSVPFLGRLGMTGNVSGVRASSSGVEGGGVRFDSIVMNLRDVHLDRGRLLRGRVFVKSMRHGDAAGTITQADLRGAVGGLPIVLGDHKISVTVAGVTASVSAVAIDGALRLSADGISIPTVYLPTTPLLPCVSRTAVVPGHLVLSCDIDRVPEILRQGVP